MVNIMMNKHTLPTLIALALAAPASAHVTLPPGGATAGTVYDAAFRVGHACSKDAAATTGLKVRLPAGFTVVEAQPRPGWTLARSRDEVSWTAASPQAGVPAAEKTSFVIRGKLTDKPGTLWFKVLQTCDQGSVDWATVPVREGDKSTTPAARLEVLPVGVAAVDVRDAWARLAVQGQTTTGVFARLSAPAGARLLGGSSPVAEHVGVHEMKMEGDVMRMRELDRGLPLPAGEAVELSPGGFNLMLTGLKQALPVGSSLPLTLRFLDPQGREASLQLQVPVVAVPPSGEASSAHAHH